jgi:hypothetical protein
MRFLDPLLLAGLGLALPILIHLINRKRAARPFPLEFCAARRSPGAG